MNVDKGSRHNQPVTLGKRLALIIEHQVIYNLSVVLLRLSELIHETVSLEAKFIYLFVEEIKRN